MSNYTVFEEIKLLPDDVLNCSYSSWHKHFKNYTFKSVIFRPLSKGFLDYLSSDGFRLPKDPKDEEITVTSENEYSDWESDEDSEVDNKEPDMDPTANFEEMHRELISTVAKLGGAVTPKMNWSAPKDAKWILMNNSLKCTSVNDIYMLLNASDHIVHDLEYSFDDCEKGSILPEIQHELVIRKWMDIIPALEFRVFIRDRKIIGISQRDLNYYDYLEKLKPELHERIVNFFNDVLLPSKFATSSYILDIYIPRPFDKVYIIDINPFSRKSDSLLFTWHELLTNQTDSHEFRLISENNVRQFSKKEFSESQVPLDVIDAATNTESMIELAKKWQELQVKGKD